MKKDDDDWILKIGELLIKHSLFVMYLTGALFGLIAGYSIWHLPGKYDSSEINAIVRLHMNGHVPANEDYKVVTDNGHVIVITPDGNFAVCDKLLKDD